MLKLNKYGLQKAQLWSAASLQQDSNINNTEETIIPSVSISDWTVPFKEVFLPQRIVGRHSLLSYGKGWYNQAESTRADMVVREARHH